MAGIDKNGEVGAVPHQVGVARVMLHQATAEDDHPRLLGEESLVVDAVDILTDVYDQARVPVLLEEKHIADRAVSDGGAEDGNVVLVSPVIDRIRVVNLLPHPPNHLRWRPLRPLLTLLDEHRIQERSEPILKLTVIVVWDEHVANAVDAALPQIRTWECGVANVVWGHALHEVLLDPARRRDDDVNHTVLDEKTYHLPHAARDHVGGVGEKDLALHL